MTIVWVDEETPLDAAHMNALEQTANRGQPDGYASLGPDGLVPPAQLPPVSGLPTGPAGGVLAGTYPDPVFAADMATQAELDAGLATKADAGTTTAALGAKVDKDSVVPAATRLVASKLAAGDAQPAFSILGNGQILWGQGGGTAPDLQLYRSGDARLRVEGAGLWVAGGATIGGALTVASLDATGQITAFQGNAAQIRLGFSGVGEPQISFGPAGDTVLHRDAAAGRLKTDGDLYAAGTLIASRGGGINEVSVGGGGLSLGGDTFLARSGAAALRVRDNLSAVGDITARSGTAPQTILGVVTAGKPGVVFGSGFDTLLYRNGVGILRTDGTLDANALTINGVPVGGGGASGPAGGVLGGNYPNPTFAVDMATQAELDAAVATSNANLANKVDKDATEGPANRLVANKILAGDANQTFRILGDGRVQWGPGGAVALDTILYRANAAVLKTDGDFGAGRHVFVDVAGGGGKVLFGAAADTNLYRGGADILKSDDQFISMSYLIAQYGTANQVLIGYVGSGPGAGIAFHNSGDTSLYRFGSAYLRVGGSGFVVDGESYVDYANAGKKLWFGSAADTNLYRSGAGVLYTDGTMGVGGLFYANGGLIRFHPSGDTQLSRDSAGVLRTPGQVIINSHLWLGGQLYSNTITAGAVGGAQANKMPIYNYAGAFVGYIPIYAT